MMIFVCVCAKKERQCTKTADRKENYAHRIISNAFFFQSYFVTVEIEDIFVVISTLILFLFYFQIDWLQQNADRRIYGGV